MWRLQGISTVLRSLFDALQCEHVMATYFMADSQTRYYRAALVDIIYAA